MCRSMLNVAPLCNICFLINAKYFQLPEAKIEDSPEEKTFKIITGSLNEDNFFKISARNENIKNCWINEIKKNVSTAFDRKPEDNLVAVEDKVTESHLKQVTELS